MRAAILSFARSTRQLVMAFRQEHIHTVVKMSPQQYVHTSSCHHNVLRLDEPTFRTMLTRTELRDFKQQLRSKHGSEVVVRHRWRPDHQRVYITYSPHAFSGSDLRTELEQELYFLLFDKCLRSHDALLTPGAAHC